MNSLLCLLLTCQVHTYAPLPPEIKDLAFIIAQEEWVYSLGKPYQFSEVLSVEEVELLQRMDCNHYACRKSVEREVKKMGYDAGKLLFWGTKAKSPQIKSFCQLLLDDLFCCKERCSAVTAPHENRCRECSGSGDYRYFFYTYYDTEKEKYQFNFQPRDLSPCNDRPPGRKIIISKGFSSRPIKTGGFEYTPLYDEVEQPPEIKEYEEPPKPMEFAPPDGFLNNFNDL
jgi:hypothetical protein